MMRLKLLIVSILAAVCTLVAVAAPQLAFAAAAPSDTSTSDVCGGIPNATFDATSGKCTTTGTSLDTIIKNVVNLLSIIIGLVSVIMIMWAGFTYVTAGGEDSKTKTAKNTILYAVIGLTVTVAAQLLVKFVLHKVTPK